MRDELSGARFSLVGAIPAAGGAGLGRAIGYPKQDLLEIDGTCLRLSTSLSVHSAAEAAAFRRRFDDDEDGSLGEREALALGVFLAMRARGDVRLVVNGREPELRLDGLRGRGLDGPLRGSRPLGVFLTFQGAVSAAEPFQITMWDRVDAGLRRVPLAVTWDGWTASDPSRGRIAQDAELGCGSADGVFLEEASSWSCRFDPCAAVTAER